MLSEKLPQGPNSDELAPSWLDRTGLFSTELTPDWIETVLLSAESGHLEYLYDLYFKIMSVDARLAGVIQARRLSSSGFDYSVTPGDASSAESQKAAELVANNLEALGVSTLKRKLFDGALYGYALFDKIWNTEEGGALYIEKINQISQSRLSFQRVGWSQDQPFGTLMVKTSDGMPKAISDFPADKLIPAVYQDKPGYYDLTGIMRPVIRFYVIKYFIIKFWAQFAETYGYPITMVTTNEGDYQKQKNTIRDFLKALGRNKWLVKYPNWEVEMREPMRSTTIDTYERLIKLCNSEMSIAILGQDMMTDGDGGSYGKAQVGERLFNQLVDNDIHWLDEVINTHIVDSITRVNYPSLDYNLYPKFKTTIDRGIDLRDASEAIRTALNIPGMKIGREWVHEQLGIPMPNDEDDVLKSGMSLLDEIDRI